MSEAARIRLDELLVARGHYATRSRARDAILRGTVTVDGRPAVKPAEAAGGTARIAIRDAGQRYVSRGALKLVHALDRFALSPDGLHALDIGASTGGFTQVLLERGAWSVRALDVGRGQLDPRLADDPRVVRLEGVNARDLAREQLGIPVKFVVCDVSFIALRLALAPALTLAEPGARLVALIKPQFEAGRGALDGRGIVHDADVHRMVCDAAAEWIAGQGWRTIGLTPSPVLGGDGNREFLIAAEKPC